MTRGAFIIFFIFISTITCWGQTASTNQTDSVQAKIELLDASIRNTTQTKDSLSGELAKLQQQNDSLLFLLYKLRTPAQKLAFANISDSFFSLFTYQGKISEYKSDLERLTPQTKQLQDKLNEVNIKLGISQKERTRLYLQQQTKLLVSPSRNNDSKPKEIPELQPKKQSTENLELDYGFESGKGKLPWPVKTGKILSYFGKHDHPSLPGVKLENNGIDIGTSSSAPVFCIFKGKVTKILNIPGANMAVLVSHGSYFSLYSNLQKVKIKEGDFVDSGQEIGLLPATTKKSKYSILKFQIWKEKQKLNPIRWIRPKAKS